MSLALDCYVMRLYEKFPKEGSINLQYFQLHVRQEPTEIRGCRYVLNVIQTQSVLLELQFVQIVILVQYLIKTELNVVSCGK